MNGVSIAIVTPLRDELANLPALFQAVASQDCRLAWWVIVENGSTDGSCEWLEQAVVPQNVDRLVVLHWTATGDQYGLGEKYATIVNYGFQYIVSHAHEHPSSQFDFIGILDADCLPSSDYYRQLANFMQKHSLGISSGVGVSETGRPDGEAKGWVRGNCRLWSSECFRNAGYVIGPSADTLSVARAELAGYRTAPAETLVYRCRETGSRVNYNYYGASSYYRGVTPTFAILKGMFDVSRFRFREGYGYVKGYFGSYFRQEPRINDPEIIRYFEQRLPKMLRRCIWRK